MISLFYILLLSVKFRVQTLAFYVAISTPLTLSILSLPPPLYSPTIFSLTPHLSSDSSTLLHPLSLCKYTITKLRFPNFYTTIFVLFFNCSSNVLNIALLRFNKNSPLRTFFPSQRAILEKKSLPLPPNVLTISKIRAGYPEISHRDFLDSFYK